MKTPKEKANELFEKMRDISMQSDVYIIQCAIITVDEILDAIDWHPYAFPNTKTIYWNNVKQELKNI